MVLTEQEARFIEVYRKLTPAEKYAVAYVTGNGDKIKTQEEMLAIGNQKIAEYNEGVIDEEYAHFAK